MRQRKFNWTHSKECTDHLGNKYPTLTAMAKAYGLTQACLSRRMNHYHWDLERSLTTPAKANGGNVCFDHNGTRYRSESLMCSKYGIGRKTFRWRIKNGWSLEAALTTPPTITKKES